MTPSPRRRFLRSGQTDRRDADLLVISHSGDRAGAPMMLVHLLRWLERETTATAEVVLLHGGHMEEDFAEEFDARVLGAGGSRLWMVERGLQNLGIKKAAGALALARVGPTMWAHRETPLTLLNSVGSLPALRFRPPSATGRTVLYVHELDQSFDRTIGQTAWDLLSPGVDHFIACADAVAEMLQRHGVPPEKISLHRGFIEEHRVEPLREPYIRRSLGVSPDAILIGGMGRPDWRKAPEVFVRVARSMARRRPDLPIHFVWIGGPMTGSPLWQLTHDIEGVGLEHRFHLTDEIEGAIDVLATLDAFLLTSREDAFPLAMLEASAMEVPVISFDNGGVREFATAAGEEPLAEVVPYLDVEAMAEAALRAITEPQHGRAMARRARRHVLENHLIDQGAPALFETLRSVQPDLGTRLPPSEHHDAPALTGTGRTR